MNSCSEDIFSSTHPKGGLHLYIRPYNCEMWWRAGWAQEFMSDRVRLHTLSAVHKNRVFSAWAHCAVFSVNGFHTLQWEAWLHLLEVVEKLISSIASLFHVSDFLKFSPLGLEFSMPALHPKVIIRRLVWSKKRGAVYVSLFVFEKD